MDVSLPLLFSIICFTHVQMGVLLVKTDRRQTSIEAKIENDGTEAQEEYGNDYFLPPPTLLAVRPPLIPVRRRGGTFGNCFAGGGCVRSVPTQVRLPTDLIEQKRPNRKRISDFSRIG